MDAHDEFEHAPLGQHLALQLCPRVDHLPVIPARQPTVVAKGGDADVDLDLEIGATVVLDEQGQVSCVVAGIVC